MFGQKSEKLLRQIDQLELELEELHINQGERAQKAESIARRVAASGRRHERSAGITPTEPARRAPCAPTLELPLLRPAGGAAARPQPPGRVLILK